MLTSASHCSLLKLSAFAYNLWGVMIFWPQQFGQDLFLHFSCGLILLLYPALTQQRFTASRDYLYSICLICSFHEDRYDAAAFSVLTFSSLIRRELPFLGDQPAKCLLDKLCTWGWFKRPWVCVLILRVSLNQSEISETQTTAIINHTNPDPLGCFDFIREFTGAGRGPTSVVSSKSAVLCCCLCKSVLGTKVVFPLAGMPNCQSSWLL